MSKRSTSRWTAALGVAVVVLAAVTGMAARERLEGTCVGVPEADVIEVWLGAGQGTVIVRLAGVDGESLRQAFGSYAKLRTKELVQDKRVTVEVLERVDDGIVVGRVIVDHHDLSYELIAEGLARHDPDVPSGMRVQVAEEQAAEAGRGMWRGARPTPTPSARERAGRATLSDIAWQVDQRRARNPWPTPTPGPETEDLFEMSIGSWVGRSADDLRAAWGPPDRVEQDGRGGTILHYDRQVTVSSFSTGDGSPPPPEGTEVTESFYVSSDGVVYHREWHRR